MIPFKIGNWLIDNEGIKWDGKPDTEYVISVDSLNEAGAGNRSEMYDWLVHLTEKTWIKEADMYALNTALVYALEYFKIGYDNQRSFVKTFIEQQNGLKRK